MKISTLHLLTLFLFLGFIVSCSDDEISPEPKPGPGSTPFVGNCSQFTFGIETDGFDNSEFTMYIQAPDGSIISREGIHTREQGVSSLNLAVGLCDNTYRLLYLEYDIEHPEDNRTVKARFGLGCQIEINNGIVKVVDNYSTRFNMFCSHIENSTDSIYNISGADDLHALAKAVNTDDSEVTPNMVFQQTCDIDLELTCYQIDKNYGWNPIGNNSNTPFCATYNGNGFKITGLKINRPMTCGVGLFGFTYMAHIKNVNISNANILGDLATGSLVGAVITSGDIKACTVIDSCSVSYSSLSGITAGTGEQSVNVGGLVGAVDEFATLSLSSSTSSVNTISAGYNAGGLVGGGCSTSVMIVGNCKSDGCSITAQFSGAGGIVATADSIYISGCTNYSTIKGGGATDVTGIGVGGIVGGSGGSYISGCVNYGAITGEEGVGGIIGSTRIKGSYDPSAPEAFMHNYTVVKYCGNNGSVSGNTAVGGICGDSNFGCYGVYNTGAVTGKAQVGGIVGAAFVAVIHNSVNSGVITASNVDGGAYCAGIIGKADISSIALDHNYGKVTSTGSHTAGIIGLSGANSVIHQCGNFGEISSTASGATGGLVGEIGDPREWSAINIAEVVIGTAELAMSVLGPIVTYVGHVIGGATHVILEISEVIVELGVFGTINSMLLYHSAHTIIHAEAIEKINETINAETTAINNEVISKIAEIRGAVSPVVNDFNSSAITGDYNNAISETLTFYSSTGGAETYNGNINNKRNELSEEIEDNKETQEIVQTVISGIALGVSVVATIGAVASSFVTGGATAATIFVTIGSVTAAISGINAIVKGSTNFADNAVIISQCINSGKVSSASNSETGGLVGILNDYGIVRDCLNTANGANSGGAFIGTAGSASEITRCLSLADFNTWNNLVVSSKSSAYLLDNYYYREGDYTPSYNAKALNATEIANSSSYSGWDIGSNESYWKIPTLDNGASFPIPNFSEMRSELSE